MRREVARLREAAERQQRQRQPESWFDRMSPADRHAADLVVSELAGLVERGGEGPPDLHPLLWALQCIMASRRGCNLLGRLSELLSRWPPAPPPRPRYDDTDDRVPAGLEPGWEKSPAGDSAGNHAGDVHQEGSGPVVPEPGEPVAGAPPATPFTTAEPELPTTSEPVLPIPHQIPAGVVERLMAVLGPGRPAGASAEQALSSSLGAV
jgi:hypothetical protein